MQLYSDIPHIGETLRARREEMGLSVEDVTECIHIRPEYIAAVESLDMSRLPSIGYTLGYVRGYANFLNMDTDEVVERYKEDCAVPHDLGVENKPHHAPRKEKMKLPRGLMPAMGIIGSVVLGSMWYNGNTDTANKAVAFAESVVETATATAEEALQASAATPEAVAEESQPALKENMVTVQVNAPSWVQIKDMNGRTIVSRVFVTGERYSVPKEAKLSLSVRDAGAVELYVGTESIGPIGMQGETLQDVPFPDPAPDPIMDPALDPTTYAATESQG